MTIEGNWRLVSYQRATAGGEISYPQGERPVGRICYDRSGHVSALLMREKRPGAEIQSTDALKDAPAQHLREIVGGCIAYFGTYRVHQDERKVVHHIEACLLPGWVGAKQERSYEFVDGRLVLSARKGDARLRLILEREPA